MTKTPRFQSRRAFLGGLAAGTVLPACPFAHAAAAASGNPAAAPESDKTEQRQPFFGLRQAGIVTLRPATGLVAAFDVTARSQDDLRRLFKMLTARASFLMQGGTAETDDPAFPPPDSGILGPVIAPDNLTVTVAVGQSLFDGRFGLAELRPGHLRRMTKFPNDALDPRQCHGDILIQICSNSTETNLHALRDILKNTPDLMVLRWKQEGTVPVRPALPGTPEESARNLLGFRDGSANPDAGEPALMNQLVWVQDGAKEPDWARDGTYMAVRIIRNFVERWDRTPLREQEQIFGREKASGAPIGLSNEFDMPDYASDPDGERTRLDAHIRLANPRRPETENSRMLRRPFNYSNGVTLSGQLDMGLLFICFQQNLERGFIAVQNRLNGEPLEEYIKPVGGGYFFVLPGVRDEHDFFASALLAAAAQSGTAAITASHPTATGD